LLARVKRTALGAYAHAELPFEQLVERLQPERSLARQPLTQVQFVFHNEPRTSLTLDGLQVEELVIESMTAKYDLSLHAAPAGDEMVLSLSYDTDLFDGETVDEVMGSYLRCLEEIGAGVDCGIWQLELGEAERPSAVAGAPLVEQISSAGLDGGSLVERFAVQVAVAGERLAVGDAQRQVSYAQLAGEAQGVARELVGRLGAGPEPVAVLLGHDAGMVAGLLGVLGAGKSYVPLDEYAPRARQEALLRESGAAAVVVDAERLTAAGWLAGSGLPLIRIDEQRGRAQSGWPGLRIDGERPAYVLYTSGTTGRPKGVMQRHGGLLGHVETWCARLALSAQDRLALFASYGYDAAVQDVFGALLAGASLHPLELRAGVESGALVDAIAGQQLSVLHFTPTVYRYLFGGRVSCTQDLSAVRLVVLGGEAARRADLELFKLRFRRPARLINGYGLTECTMGLQYVADHDTRAQGEQLPIGWPVGGLQMRLRGADGQLCHGAGELEIASAHLAAGYLNDESLTAERFTADPQAPGGRWYRTGDRLRRRPDGAWVHEGRVDGQLKLRGMRVERGEVEAALAGCAGVREAVLIGRRLAPGDPRGELQLCAYVAGVAGLQAGQLRAELRGVLPESLIPAELIVLPALPRLANGKLDGERLPGPAAGEQAGASVPPRTEIEQRLAAIWSGVLGRPRIGVHDDFFALGGHSLLATRVMARIRGEFGCEIPLSGFFQHPTIASFALLLRDAGLSAARATTYEPALRRRAREPHADSSEMGGAKS
jgi:amino acid adenylation domain-containing protein